LTTYETLYYAALLRLPREWTREAKLQRVEMVLDGLGLGKARDTIIGNHMMRGVSGQICSLRFKMIVLNWRR
jgi:ATP-binding cassette, subfamily G (WHITE), member 2